MIEKRFTIIYGVDKNPFEWDIMDNEKDILICQCNGKPICDLLNALNDENEQLKQKIEKLEDANDYLIYVEEKTIINEHKHLQNKFMRLKQENEQLKQVSQDYEDNVSNWFIENWHTLSDKQKQSAHLELGIDIEYGDD